MLNSRVFFLGSVSLLMLMKGNIKRGRETGIKRNFSDF